MGFTDGKGRQRGGAPRYRERVNLQPGPMKRHQTRRLPRASARSTEKTLTTRDAGRDAGRDATSRSTRSAALTALLSCGLGALGCGGAPRPSSQAASASGGGRAGEAGGLRATVDPAPFLQLEPPKAARTWLKARSARLDVGDEPAIPDSEGDPVEVMLVEPGATLVRVAWRGPAARFVVWVERRDLFGVLKRDVPFRAELAPPTSPAGGTLRQGAAVEVLERTAERSKIRYSGAVELETWVPNDSLSADGEPVDRGSPSPRGKIFHAAPGLAIRSEPRWGSPLVAALARTYFVSEVRALDDAWSEVEFSDDAVTVRGFASRRDPPVRLAGRASASQPMAPSTIEANEKLPGGVCLYARERGEQVGISNEVAVAAQRGGAEGWWAVTMETPWGPMQFAAERAATWKMCEAPKP